MEDFYYTDFPRGSEFPWVLIYFAGTDPRNRGRPLAQDWYLNDVGNPREQWERSWDDPYYSADFEDAAFLSWTTGNPAGSGPSSH